MNIRDIALKGDINIFREYLDLGLHTESYDDACFIFNYATVDIGQEYYDRYSNSTNVLYAALKYTGLITSKYRINRSNVAKHAYHDLLLSVIDFLIFDVNILRELPGSIIVKLTKDHIDGIIEYDDIEGMGIINANPGLVYVCIHEFSCNTTYDYRELALLIQHDRVVYRDIGNINRRLVNIINGVRQYIPNWKPRISDKYDKVIELDVLIDLIDIGAISKGQVFTIFLEDIPLDLFVEYIDYANDATILQVYLQTGQENLRNKLEPVVITFNAIHDTEISLLYELGEEYWKEITFDFCMLEPTNLSNESLYKLNEIVMCTEYNISLIFGCNDLILIYEFFPSIPDLEVRYEPWIFADLRHVSCKRGIERLWRQYSNQPKLVQFFCNYLPFSIPKLYPHISREYYKYMNKKLLMSIRGIVHMEEYTDCVICCEQIQ